MNSAGNPFLIRPVDLLWQGAPASAIAIAVSNCCALTVAIPLFPLNFE
jgi:hypothetical protein